MGKENSDTTTVSRLSQIQSAMVCGKSQRNDFAHFNYRSCEDLLKAVKPLLLEGELILLKDELVELCGNVYVKSLASFSTQYDDIIIEVPSFAREPESKKGMDAAQITGCTSSYSRKYALNGLLLTDDGVDSDSLKPGKEEYEKPSSIPRLTTIKNVLMVTEEYKESHKKFGESYTKYTIIDGNDNKYSTFTKKYATIAKKAKEEELQVNIGFKVAGKFKNLTFIDIQMKGKEEGNNE